MYYRKPKWKLYVLFCLKCIFYSDIGGMYSPDSMRTIRREYLLFFYSIHWLIYSMMMKRLLPSMIILDDDLLPSYTLMLPIAWWCLMLPTGVYDWYERKPWYETRYITDDDKLMMKLILIISDTDDILILVEMQSSWRKILIYYIILWYHSFWWNVDLNCLNISRPWRLMLPALLQLRKLILWRDAAVQTIINNSKCWLWRRTLAYSSLPCRIKWPSRRMFYDCLVLILMILYSLPDWYYGCVKWYPMLFIYWNVSDDDWPSRMILRYARYPRRC